MERGCSLPLLFLAKETFPNDFFSGLAVSSFSFQINLILETEVSVGEIQMGVKKDDEHQRERE